MLSKKILHLKTKIKNYHDSIISIASLTNSNKELNLRVSSLNIKISNQESKLKNLTKHQKDVNDLECRISELEKYKEICENDITVMASAVTELYNILHSIVLGKLVINRNVEDEIFPTSDDLAYEELFEDEDYLEDDKKKKKVYH
jgi:predicted  nucleic acid-binding Zn-ribbon protein